MDSKLSKGKRILITLTLLDVTAGTSIFRNHLHNGALDNLDMMTLGLVLSKLSGQYSIHRVITNHYQSSKLCCITNRSYAIKHE